MIIPYKFSLQRHEYTVSHEFRLKHDVRGRVWYPWDGTHGGIQLATHRLGTLVPHKRRVQVFWHEVVHAILHEMGRDDLDADERFVEEFAKRLTQIVYTARLP